MVGNSLHFCVESQMCVLNQLHVERSSQLAIPISSGHKVETESPQEVTLQLCR